MSTIAYRLGPASKLTAADLGRVVRVMGSDRTVYEGALSYLSFDIHGRDDELVAVALGNNDDPLQDVIVYLAGDHSVEVEMSNEPTDEPGDW